MFNPENPVTPRRAAACVLMRPSGEVLLGQRNQAMRFMAGHYVFPGGRIDEDESGKHVVDAADPDHARTIHAIAREVFEETGVLTVEGTLPNPDDIHRARELFLAGEVDFDELLDRESLVIPAARFSPAGKWITPGNSPIRFDTQYMLYDADESQSGTLIEGEMIALDWFTPGDARRRWQTREIDMPAPVAYTLQHFDALPRDESLALLQRPTDRYPGVPTRVEWSRGINWIPLVTATIPPATHTNCIVVGERELYVIDPGSDRDEELAFLYDQLDHMIALGGRVKAVVLTHSHIDHVAGAGHVHQRYEAPIWAHEATDNHVEFEVDRHIRDDDVIPIEGDPGWRLRALHTPGHDSGHLCFVEETTETLIAGDMVANPGTIVVSRSFNGNMQEFMDSLHRLRQIDSRVMLPAHGHPVWDPTAYVEQNIEHREMRENKVKDALESEGPDFQAVLRKAYDDVPTEALPLAKHSLDAILAKLGVDLQR